MTHGLAWFALVGAGVGASVSASAAAEQLDIDHRLYPPLHAAMENPRDGTVFYDASKPGKVFDRILVAGTSAERDWSEALELVVTPRKGAKGTAQDWFGAFSPTGETPCPARVTRLGEDDISVTFAVEAAACPGSAPLSGLYRVVYGRKSVFVVGAKVKGAMSPSQRQQWLALLGSAKLSG